MKIDIDQLLQQGVTAQKEGKLEEAEQLYRNILESDPRHPNANHNLGIILILLNKSSEEAEASLKKAIKFKPDYVDAYNNLGLVQKISGKFKEAELSITKAIELEPENANAYNNLGTIQEDFKQFEKAEESFKKAIKFKPDYADAHYNLGNTLNNLQRIDEAETTYKKVIEIKPDYANAHNNLAIVQKKLGKYEEAEVSYKKTIKLKPDFAEAYSNLGVVLKDIGNFDEAIACYKKAIELKPNYETAHYNLGLALYESGKFKEAAEEFKLNDFRNSKELLLVCLFKMNEQKLFYEQLDYLIKRGDNNALIGSLISLAEIKFKINRENLFCKKPLKYILKTDLIKNCDFKTIFVKTIKDVLDNDLTSFKSKQLLLTKGNQTAGNIFTQVDFATDEIQKIIRLEIDKYRTHFKDSEEGFLKNWPSNYDLNGWLVNMKSGGNLSPHMHENGWVSGSVYINVPPKLKADSGNLVVSIEDEQSNLEENKKSIDVVTGSLCLFPSSLHHYTIPFESNEERIVLAFDVIPK